MPVDWPGHRHVARREHRGYCDWRRNAESADAACVGPAHVFRTGPDFGGDPYRVEMGTCGRYDIAGWILSGCCSSQQFAERSDFVLFRTGFVGCALCHERTFEAPDSKTPIGLKKSPEPTAVGADCHLGLGLRTRCGAGCTISGLDYRGLRCRGKILQNSGF